MTDAFDGARAKVINASRHLNELQAHVAASNYGDEIGFAQHFDADTSTVEVTLQGIPQLPLIWSLMAADSVQNLRCALNYVAWELSRWNLARQGESREPKSATQFPINTRARQFDADRLPDAHPDHVARIQAIQPNGPDTLMQLPEDALRNYPLHFFDMYAATHHALGVLVDLTNEDKHRVLPGVLVSAGTSFVGNYTAVDCHVTGEPNYFIQGPGLENGAKWAEFQVTPTGPKPEVRVHDKIIPTITFGNNYRLDSLAQMVNWVGHTVESLAALAV